MEINTDTVTEDEAITAYHALAHRFGWNGTFFTRSDAESSWSEYHDQTTPLSDEQWNIVTSQWEWRKGLNDSLTELGWGLVHEAVGVAVVLSEAGDE